ncbi:hypothetical protein H0H93_007645 [Arthromyces matolae]|nr:hypothetical protein H0H93_007645 [Arthromyces matolae]
MLEGVSSSMPLPLFSLIGWSLVPDFVTKNLLSSLHRFKILPTPKAPATHRKQYALTFACVVLGYLSYNLIDSSRSMQSNFYHFLGVSPSVSEQGLKAAFRQFAKKNHPDRPGVGREGEELFVAVRDMYEALKNPTVRFAYDRFGPDVLEWSKTCSTPREYIEHGLMNASGYHIFVGFFLAFWSLVGSSKSDPVSFWRYILFLTFGVAEIGLILSPPLSSQSTTTSAIEGLKTTYTTFNPLQTLFPHRTVHQHILFLHQLFLFLSIALSRVVPVLISAFYPDQSLSPAQTQELSHQIQQLSSIADRETSIALHTLLHSVASSDTTQTSPSSRAGIPHEHISSLARPRPFVLPTGILDLSDPRTQSPDKISHRHIAQDPDSNHPLVHLVQEIEELIIETNIKKEDGPLRSTWEAAIRRGRKDDTLLDTSFIAN